MKIVKLRGRFRPRPIFRIFVLSFFTLAFNIWGSFCFDGVDEASKPVMEEARRRIERIRKGTFSITFVDESGAPVTASARIRLVRHQFQFGANLSPVLRLPSDHPARRVALEVIDELFSLVRVGHFWSIEEPKRGGPLNWAPTDEEVEWALAHHKQMRYHCVIYNMYYAVPKWYKQIKSEEAWWPLIEKRIRDVASKYGRIIYEYDIINEMIMNLKWADKHNPLFPTLADPKNAAKILNIADKYLPQAKLVMLETHLCTLKNPHYRKVYKYYRQVIEEGAPVDVIGFQGHFYGGGRMPISRGHPQAGEGAFTMKVISDCLDNLAALGKPIHITEYNPPSRMKKRQGPQPRLMDKEIAAWTVNYYTLIFSKPYIHQLTRWFVVDGCGGNAIDGGLVTVEGKKKPNYYALKKLLKSTWNTKWQGRLEGGRVKLRAFFGEYEASVSGYRPVKFNLYSHMPRRVVVHLTKR
ncbi:MAG: hypothetical protein B1H08_06175 [Candidatus Omnitrophica bacterium 4484_171]|nr:MAG: hypothetical protein B1H08_06175 [Candidatus Omnitrophica bacterium 4484_171]